MNFEQLFSNSYMLDDLNSKIRRHTNFKDFEDMVDVKNNYRPVMKFDPETPHYAMSEITEIADIYDAWMISKNDPRRIYRQD